MKELLDTFVRIAPSPAAAGDRRHGSWNPRSPHSPGSSSRSTRISTPTTATASRSAASVPESSSGTSSTTIRASTRSSGSPPPRASWRTRGASSTKRGRAMWSACTTRGISRSATRSPKGNSSSSRGSRAFRRRSSRRLVNGDPFKSKQLEKGIRQLTDEGVAQLFERQPGNIKIVGTVGELQFEVIQFRLLQEYGARVRFPGRWTSTRRSGSRRRTTGPARASSSEPAADRRSRSTRTATRCSSPKGPGRSTSRAEMFPEIEFHSTSDFKTDAGTG